MATFDFTGGHFFRSTETADGAKHRADKADDCDLPSRHVLLTTPREGAGLRQPVNIAAQMSQVRQRKSCKQQSLVRGRRNAARCEIAAPKETVDA